MSLKKTTLSTGLLVPPIINGLWQIADMERKKGADLNVSSTAETMLRYVESGLTTFDMADHYGSAEVIAGHFKKHFPEAKQAQMLTKWVPQPGKSSKEETRKAVEKSLERFQSDCLDLLQFHAWQYANPEWLDQLFWLHELQEEGLIAHLGLTNFDAAHLRMVCASGIPICTNQVSYSLLDRRASGEMKVVCEKYGVKLLAYGTLAGGFLSDKWLNKPEPKLDESASWSMMKYKRFIEQSGGWKRYQEFLSTIAQIAAKHQVSIANVATSFILKENHVASVIIGARLGENTHIEDNLRTLKVKLDAEDIQQIQKAQEELESIPGDCGDEYRTPPYLTASGDLSHHVDNFPAPYPSVQRADGAIQVFSGTPWEGMAGYCRAIRKGNRISVSGTTATHGNRMIGGKDAEAQAHFVLDKIEAALISLGGSLGQVIRTRIFVNQISDWEAVAKAHGKKFGKIQPANTLVEAKLVGEGYLVEIEAEAEL